jgi:hypothetical protein
VRRQFQAGDPSDINFDAKHVLFVEGSDDSLDLQCLEALLTHLALVLKPLGPASNLKAVARALHRHYPFHYFLVDRDHYFTDQEVEASWLRFPDPEASNLLIWRKKELENYFLDPGFFLRSDHLNSNASSEAIAARLQEECQRRLFVEVANCVIVELRESLKLKWIETFAPSTPLTSADAVDELVRKVTASPLRSRATATLDEVQIRQAFDVALNRYTGGGESLDWGRGEWLNLFSGKPLFHNLVDRFCKVVDMQGKVQSGPAARARVARNLMSKSEHLPSDFLELVRLLEKVLEV